MIIDTSFEFADADTVGALNNSTGNVGDYADLGETTPPPLGAGEPMALVVQVSTAITSGGAATVRFRLVSDSTTSIATDGSASMHAETDDIPVATLVAGKTYVLPVGHGVAMERYLAVQAAETAGQALTAGAINAFMVPQCFTRYYANYPDAVN